MELSTQGWSLMEKCSESHGKQADARFRNLLKWTAPDRLKIVVQDDPRYPTDVDPGLATNRLDNIIITSTTINV